MLIRLAYNVQGWLPWHTSNLVNVRSPKASGDRRNPAVPRDREAVQSHGSKPVLVAVARLSQKYLEDLNKSFRVLIYRYMVTW
jgi:hypothetical protein